MLEIGDWVVRAVTDGDFALDGGAMFGMIPKPLWEKSCPADERNRIRLALRCLLITPRKPSGSATEETDHHRPSSRAGRRAILVDTGIGDKLTPGEREIYRVADEGERLLRALAGVGVSPQEVTDVIITHLHLDHAGGVTRIGEDGEVQLTFPQATHHVQRRNWLWAHHPTERDEGSYPAKNFAVLEGSGQLHLIDGGTEIFPGIELIVSEGHTVGQQLVKVSDGKQTLIYCGDLIPTSAHLRLPYIMAYDLYPLVTLEEKKMLLAQALEENWVLAFEHDPELVACRIKEEGGGVTPGEEVEL